MHYTIFPPFPVSPEYLFSCRNVNAGYRIDVIIRVRH